MIRKLKENKTTTNTNTSDLMSVERDHAAPASAQMWTLKEAIMPRPQPSSNSCAQRQTGRFSSLITNSRPASAACSSCDHIIRLMGRRLMLTCQQSSYRWDLQVCAGPSIIWLTCVSYLLLVFYLPFVMFSWPHDDFSSSVMSLGSRLHHR